MTPERRAKLIALGELHERRTKAKLRSADFDPGNRPGSRDYNIHFADLESDDAFHREAMAIFAS